MQGGTAGVKTPEPLIGSRCYRYAGRCSGSSSRFEVWRIRSMVGVQEWSRAKVHNRSRSRVWLLQG